MHKGDPHAILNLQEVTAYDKDGKVIAPLSSDMSSHFDVFTVGKCHDGKTDGNNFCHSDHDMDKDPWLVFGYRADADISKIVVVNRINCCENRIVGASIRICSDSG